MEKAFDRMPRKVMEWAVIRKKGLLKWFEWYEFV